MPGPANILWGPAHIQIYNDAYIAIARDRHPALLGRPAAEGWPEIHAEVLAPMLETVLAGRAMRISDLSVTLLGPNGHPEERVFATTWSPIRDGAGAVAGALEILVEVSDRREAQAALRESETRYRFLIESWTQAVWETDANGVVVADSPSWRAYTGQTLEEWLGYGWLDAIHPGDRAYAERQWREAIAAHGLVDADFRLRTPGGGWRWTNVRAAPVLDAAKRVEKWVGMNMNIDARKRAEAALREREEQQEFLLSLSDAFGLLALPAEITAVATARLCERLGVARVYYGEIAGNLLKVERDYTRGVPSLVGEHSLEPFGPDFIAAYRPGAVIMVEDAGHDPRLTPAARAELHGGRIAAFADAVLFEEDGEVSVLAVQSAAPRAWSASEEDLIREVGERVKSAIKRARAETALRESEERQRFLLALGDAMRAEPSAGGKIETAARHLGKRLKASRVLWAEYDWQNGLAHIFNGWFAHGAQPFPTVMRLKDYDGEVLNDLRAPAP
ncbi:PAS domain-containing protein [Roseomonas sp. KE2513]|uniref:PAS domain-containing protein n=1 Tax=Roseomonas sp. KE2513 TaxID=2479202 RepID=UPI0018DEFC43|nr:PAS domain-containing protein [Roseomonas sp. KE2513]